MLAELVFSMTAMTTTDQTVQVAKGSKLDVNNFAGDVNVKVWDRDSVRVEVTHSDREAIDIKQDEQILRIRGRSLRGGPPRSLDYTITVPGWMAINVNGTYADVTLEGVGGDVAIETTRGDIKVRGGSGFISLKSVQGEISLEKAKGRVEVRATASPAVPVMKRAAPAAPALSLSDYLKRRKGGTASFLSQRRWAVIYPFNRI